jgi:UDP:flavonoid glycosyltransferase YjiC (YdhE family)
MHPDYKKPFIEQEGLVELPILLNRLYLQENQSWLKDSNQGIFPHERGKMRITILSVGTRGDVQPYIALGLGLQQAGHEVRLATHSIFQEFVSSWGLDFAPLAGNPQEWLQQQGEQFMLESQKPIRQFTRLFRSIVEPILADSWQACQGTEAIIYTPLAVAGYHIAEKLGVPAYSSAPQPRSHTRAFPSPLLRPRGRLGGIYNWLTYSLVQQIFWQSLRKPINQWRQETLNLPPIPLTGPYTQNYEQRLPLLYCYSPTVVPKPPDWLDQFHVSGYWFLDHRADWQPPADLVKFLAAGSPPVYIGFGSLMGQNPEALTKLVLESLGQAGQRGILLTGWGGLTNADLPDDVFKIESVPFDWLFPQLAAVVHHGGAGTTAAALRAGVPSIILPFLAENFFWGQRVTELGAGPPPISQKQLTAERLATAIRTATSDEIMKASARALGEKIRAEDGVARAVEVFHRYLPSH